MRKNAASGFPLTVSVFTIIVLLCVTGTTYAKRGCSAFGHSCFGGHGKRFDPHFRDLTFQGNELPTSDSTHETGVFRLSNQFLIPQEKSRGRQEVLLPRRQASLRFDPYTLPSIVQQWLMSHHRLHQPEMELNNK
ncbi:uncharacterized protein LOC114878087 [Osmia bicornis bicornis]|uniref:uncharacterized protein LOC114878087 n=1 Tax=Osmia bicornis bicornis TaxID=1437191 RepID=UPI0010F61287|nr:uncharacterized protein LOC114878087 [Osmia bicornis bicornis]